MLYNSVYTKHIVSFNLTTFETMSYHQQGYLKYLRFIRKHFGVLIQPSQCPIISDMTYSGAVVVKRSIQCLQDCGVNFSSTKY